MIQLIESSQYLPYIQLIMVGLFFFALFVFLHEPKQHQSEESHVLESEPPGRNEADRLEQDPNSELNLKQSEETSDYSENFIFNPATGKTNFVDVSYK